MVDGGVGSDGRVRVDRRTALAVLGLGEDADLPALKRRFRELARTRHPDRGGDRTGFQDLHTAYELLRSELAAAPAATTPTVARGRPSRSDVEADAARTLDDAQLGAQAVELARLVVAGGARLSSRAPDAWSNRIAHALSAATTSTLVVTLDGAAAPDARRRALVTLTGRSRTARRALATLDLAGPLGAAWTRHRGDAVTVIEARVAAPDAGTAAHRAAAATVRLLDALGWPLEQWRPD
jgi:hypothetical protein